MDFKDKVYPMDQRAAEMLIKSSTNYSKSDDKDVLSMIMRASGTAKADKVPSLAFTESPNQYDHYAGMFKIKRKLLPDDVIKRIKNQDHLVACILRSRGNTGFMLGKPRKDRFGVGYEVDIRQEVKKEIEPEQMEKIERRISKFKKTLDNCGSNEGLRDNEKLTLPMFIKLQFENGLGFGRHATEFIYDHDDRDENEKPKFHRFRPRDPGTIYKAVRKGEMADNLRRASLKMLETQTGDNVVDKIDMDIMNDYGYAYIQVLEGQPKQAFTGDEMYVYNIFPTTDVEHNGYPLTPLDTAITAVTTHISIEAYNQLYFQNGRAAKGMIVLRSDDVDQNVIDNMKNQFMSTVNNVSNSFHFPIFGVGEKDNVEWVPMVAQRKDGEFEFLYDSVSRNILASFNMSPDELPGYGHLSRGTNQQSMSESNNEYKLTAARDTGLRPLIAMMEDFLNDVIFPKLDPQLSQICVIRLAGLDAKTEEQESLRLQQDTPLHFTYDEVLESVDKERIGKHLAGSMPFNEHWHLNADKFTTVGEVMADLKEDVGALLDPFLKFRRDPFYFQHLQMIGQVNPMLLKAMYSTSDLDWELLLELVEEELEGE